MTREEILARCEQMRNFSKIDLLGIRVYDLRCYAIHIENKYLYNKTYNNAVKICGFTDTLKTAGLQFTIIGYLHEKSIDMFANNFLRFFGTSVDDLQGKFLDYMFSAKPKPTIEQTWNNKANIVNTGITALKHVLNNIFG